MCKAVALLAEYPRTGCLQVQQGGVGVGKRHDAITSGEFDRRLREIGSRLRRLGLRTQPEVAAKIVKIASDDRAGLDEYARIVSSDSVLSGRLLKIANSAYFAQRSAVTRIDRACVLLGLQRMRALSLGFYVSRAAVNDANAEVARRIWTGSVYRACLASSLAREMVPSRAPEAFVIGLLLEAGVPPMHQLLGECYTRILDAHPHPLERFEAESNTLEYTSVDVITALTREWELPELLAGPISLQRIEPEQVSGTDEFKLLHQIAFLTSAIQIAPDDASPAPTAQQELQATGLDQDRLDSIVRSSIAEYQATRAIFSDVADAMPEIERLFGMISHQLVEAMEGVIIDWLKCPQEHAITIRMGGQLVQLEFGADGVFHACLFGDDRRPVVSHDFRAESISTWQIRRVFELEVREGDQDRELAEFLQRFGAKAA